MLMILLTTIVLVVTCIRYALGALTTVRKSRDLYGSFPFRGLYNQRDLVEACPSYVVFNSLLAEHTVHDDRTCAMADLWTGINTHYWRYHRLRRAILLLSAAAAFFMVAIAAVLVTSTIWPS